MRLVHVVVPSGLDDQHHPSGGNVYGRQLITQLPRLGWTVRECPVTGPWPEPQGGDLALLAAALRGIPDGGIVLVDGLIASAAGDTLARESQRLHQVIVVHMALDRPAEAEALAAARTVVATSRWTADWLRARYALTEVVVAAPGVESGPAALGTPGGGSWLSVAAVTALKGHDLVVSALAGIRELPWSWKVVGALDVEPDFVARLRAQVERAGLTERIRFTGPLPRDQVSAAYRTADLLVHASRRESYGMVVAEAQAHGLPTVATAVEGLPDTVGDAGRLVPPEDPRALADALASWLADQRLRGDLRAAALSRGTSLPSWLETAHLVATALAEASR